MSKTVTLSRRYEIGSSIFDKLRFREPKMSDYRQIGRAYEVQKGTVIVYSENVWAYVDRLVVDVPHGALSELDLTDALAVEGAVLDFFAEANEALRKRESSSSGSDGVPQTSMT